MDEDLKVLPKKSFVFKVQGKYIGLIVSDIRIKPDSNTD
jgi:hypothetical protein